MKKTIPLFILLAACFAFPVRSLALRHKVPRYLKKETTVDMSQMNRIFLGWVDLGVDGWAAHGYDSKEQWSEVIDGLNEEFASQVAAVDLPGKTIVRAKRPGDDDAKGCDLAIRFTDVYVDYDNYHLVLGIQFIDPRTGQVLGSIPVRPYYGNDWGLRQYLAAALKEVGIKLHVEVMGGSDR